MSSVQYKKHRVFRETPDVIFYDISVDDSNASDLVVHEGPAVSPPDDVIGAKQFTFIIIKWTIIVSSQVREHLNLST